MYGSYGWEVKLCDPLTMRAIPESFCDEVQFTEMHYIKCPHLYLY